MPDSLCPALNNPRLVGDPVDTLTGAAVDEAHDFRLVGPLDFWWVRHYDSSQSHRRFALGWGHTHQLDCALRFDTDGIRYDGPLGRRAGFPPLANDGDEFASNGYVLRRLSRSRYELSHHGEPNVEFTFRDSQAVARPKRIFRWEHEISFGYSAEGRLERIVDSAGRTIRVVEEADGRIVSLTLAGERGKPGVLLVSYQYDERGNLLATTDRSGHGFTYAYDEKNRMIRRTGRKGFSFHFVYDEQGRCSKSAGDDRTNEVSLEYELPGRITKVTRADGGVWTYLFDEAGGLLQVVDPLKGVQQFVRDKSGRAQSEEDPNGNVTRMVYDRAGNPVSKITPLGYMIDLPEDLNAPDPTMHRVADNPSEYEFGRLVAVDDITLPEPEMAAALRLPSVVRPLVATRPGGTKPTGALPSYKVEPLGPVWWPDPKPGRTFNEFGQLIQQRDDEGRLRHWSYDPSGNVVAHTDFDGGKWSYDLGKWHLRLGETDPLGANVRFRYNPSGKMVSCADSGSTRTEYTFDLKDNLIEVKRHGVVRDKYVRDPVGNLVAKHAGDGRVLLKFEIGLGNLKTKRTLASGEEHTFAYDKHGRYLTASSKKDEVKFEYDGIGNSRSEQRNGRGVTHRFHGWRTPVETVFFERFTVRYERSEDGTLTVTDPGGKRHKIRFHPHGLLERQFSNESRETAQYDCQGRCFFKCAQFARGQTWSRRFHWSGEGELRRVQDSRNGETRHEYDAAHRLQRRILPGDRVEDYELDLAGNLVRQPGLNDVHVLQGNRLHSAGGMRVEYNDRNHIAMRESADGLVRYAYDSRDQLVSVETPHGSWTADYDALGRRTRKTWAGQTTEYYWNGDQLVAEISAGGRLRLYVYPDHLALTPLLFLDYDSVDAPPESGRRYFIYSDQIGTPCLIEDESGNEVWQARTEPYGRAAVKPGARIEFNLRFPGHHSDAELGLHYNRFRHYDPLLGRYLQSDPWGIAGGYNLYAYCPNPLFRVDVRGLGEKGNPEHDKENEQDQGDEEGQKSGPQSQEEENAQAARDAGMKQAYLVLMQQQAEETGQAIIMRDTNVNSAQYQDDPNYIPKPHDCLLKTDPGSGLVTKPDWDSPRYSDMSPEDKAAMQANEQQLLANKWTYDGQGYLVNPDGKRVYGDHDVQGAYNVDANGNYVTPPPDQVDTNNPQWKQDVNNATGPPPMVQHGANDQYIDPVTGQPLRNPGPNESYTIIKPDGTVERIGSTAELEQYYKDHGIPWNYPHYSVITFLRCKSCGS